MGRSFKVQHKTRKLKKEMMFFAYIKLKFSAEHKYCKHTFKNGENRLYHI